MKTTIILIIAGFLSVTGYSQTQTNAATASAQTSSINHPNGPVAKFDTTVYVFPDLIQGVPGTAKFELTNTGKEPLIIASANASCGCTNLTYDKEPILPGKSISIKVTYNAAAMGAFTKTITVKTNAADQPVVLQIRGNVVPKS
jgi:hypothetical protein